MLSKQSRFRKGKYNFFGLFNFNISTWKKWARGAALCVRRHITGNPISISFYSILHESIGDGDIIVGGGRWEAGGKEKSKWNPSC